VPPNVGNTTHIHTIQRPKYRYRMNIETELDLASAVDAEHKLNTQIKKKDFL
jgi:hypothetical protein